MLEAKGSKCGADVFLFFLAFPLWWKVTSRITHISFGANEISAQEEAFILVVHSYCSQISPEWVLNQSRTLKFHWIWCEYRPSGETFHAVDLNANEPLSKVVFNYHHPPFSFSKMYGSISSWEGTTRTKTIWSSSFYPGKGKLYLPYLILAKR
jgi:hypothetical protein